MDCVIKKHTHTSHHITFGFDDYGIDGGGGDVDVFNVLYDDCYMLWELS